MEFCRWCGNCKVEQRSFDGDSMAEEDCFWRESGGFCRGRRREPRCGEDLDLGGGGAHLLEGARAESKSKSGRKESEREEKHQALEEQKRRVVETGKEGG